MNPFEEPLRLIGYWSGGYAQTNGWPDAASFVDLGWDEDERVDVGLYLQRGIVVRASLGYSPCRLCDRVRNGNLELTDGTYAWPEGLAHYVLDHSVRLPQEFIEHVGEQGRFADGASITDTWWRSHGRRHDTI